MEAVEKDSLTDRQTRIIEIVNQQGFATIETLANDFGVSYQSVRRDIIKLDAGGVLQRFHGGVGIRETAARLGYAEKQTLATNAKQLIAGTASSLIADGSVVFLDVGTTVEAVAETLRDRRQLRVFTTSLAVATILAGRPNINVFILGGTVGGADGSVVGETTLATLMRFRFDYAVIGFSGIDQDGTPMDHDLEKVAIKQVAMEQSGCTLLVGDSSKFTKSAVVRFATNRKSIVFITETLLPAAISEKIPGQLIVAEPASLHCRPGVES